MLEELTEKEFNEFSRNNKNSIFFESSYWGELKKSTGWIYYMLGYKLENKIICATLLLGKKIPVINKYIYYAPRGFLIDYNNYDLVKEFTDGIKKFVKKNKGIFFTINPLIMYQERDINGNVIKDGINNKRVVDNLKQLGYRHVGFTKTYGKDIEPRWISVLDIKDKTIEEINNNYNKTTKWEVKDSYKHGLKLIEANEEEIEEFKKMMVHTSLRRGFVDRPLSYYQKMYQEFKGNIKIMLVELNVKENLETYQENKEKLEEKLNFEKSKEKILENRIKELEMQLNATNKKIEKAKELLKDSDKFIIASGLFMTFGPQVVSLFGASYKEFMNYKGQYFLNNEMIKYAIENNYEKYNFYGITGDFSETSPMYGLFDYKRGFGAYPIELIGEFTYITNKFYNTIYNIMYKCYNLLKKVKK